MSKFGRRKPTERSCRLDALPFLLLIRAMKHLWLVAGLLLWFFATSLWPRPMHVSQVGLGPPPWPENGLRLAALGRSYAAADVAWLRTIQLIGSSDLERQKFPQLEGWVDLVSRFDPRFETPYVFGAVLLATYTDRMKKVDQILARGEQHLADNFLLPMMRGFLAYVGLQDSAVASGHYQRAASKPNAPPYVAMLARRLEGNAASCEMLAGILRDMQAQSQGERAGLLSAEQKHLLVDCWSRRIEAAATRFRLDQGRDGKLEELIAEGLPPPPTPPGQCWNLHAGRARLKECTR